MNINKSIFKAYDVRGIYPTDLNEAAAYQVGRAFIRFSGAKNVVICQDARLSSPELFKALVQGVLAEGAQVTSIGQMPTECLYFAVAKYDFDGGIMITASHNPKEYNGFKMVKKDGSSIRVIPGTDLLSFLGTQDVNESTDVAVNHKDIWPAYIDFMGIFSSDIKPFKIVVDASNGVVGKSIENMRAHLPVEIIDINFEPDGNFPNHSPNPLEKGSVDQIAALIKEKQADFGIMFDGDADRVFLVDEQGELVKSDIVLLLLAQYFLRKNPGSTIAYNLLCSKAVPEFIKTWGGVPVRTQVGFVKVQEALIESDGIVGGELSGHYCFRDYFYMDSGMIAFLMLLQMLSQDGRQVSDIVKELSPYAKSVEFKFSIKDTDAVLEKVKAKYTAGNQDYLDGVTVEYDNWWFNLRPSNTEPLIKLTLEADRQELLDEKKQELIEFINNSKQ